MSGRLIALGVAVVCTSWMNAEPGAPILLWEGTAPGEKGDIPAEKIEVGGKDGIERTSNVSIPAITYLPSSSAKRSRAVVLVCPGGGYNILASEHEGTAVGEWLNGIGVDAVLLKYRVPRRKDLPKHQAPLQDAQRAMGIIRSRAEEWNIDPGKIGVLGFSAGGHLATMTLVSPERTYPLDPKVDGKDCRPNFGILIYPAYQLDEADPEKLAPEVKLDENFPPVFIAVASDDKWASSSARLYLELQRLKAPVEMHAFAKGGHGFGITKKMEMPLGEWPELCARWLSETIRIRPE